MPSVPKRHHFLPRFYLEGFTRGGSLWLYDRERKQFRSGTPEKTAIIGHYYAFETKSGERNYSVEELLSQVEGKAKDVILRLQTRAEITIRERLDLALFIALLMTRTPKFEREVQQIADSAAKRIMQHMVPSVEAAAQFLCRNKASSEITPEEIFKFIHAEEFNLETPRTFVIHTMLEKAPKAGMHVFLMNWTIAHADQRTSFITTDEPLGFVVPDEFRRTHEPVLGLTSEKVTKLIPLTQTTALMVGAYGGELNHCDLSREEVRHFNIAVATECEGYVIGRDEALVRSIVRASKVDEASPGTKMRVDHILHPTDPTRTYLVARRVTADCPEVPPEIIPHEGQTPTQSERGPDEGAESAGSGTRP